MTDGVSAAAGAATPVSAADRRARRDARAGAFARGAAAVALTGTFLGPALVNLAALVLVVSFACMPSAGARLRSLWATPLARAVLLLFAVMAAATLWSEASFIDSFRAFRGWRTLLLLIVCLAIFDQPAARRNALLTFVAVASLGAIYSFWAWGHGYSTTVVRHPNMTGTVWRDPVVQGMAFALACFLAMMLAISQRELGRRLRLALVLSSLLLLVNLAFVSSSRSAHVALLILFVATSLQVLNGWRRFAAIVILPLLAVFAFSISPMLQARFGLAVQELRAPLASKQMSSMGLRYVIWSVSQELVRKRPLLGFGMGGFAPAYKEAIQKTSYTGWASTPITDPHNQYLYVQLEAGIVGTAAFAWFLVACFRHRGEAPYRAWGRSVLLAWCAASLATSLFSNASEGHMVMLTLGVLLSAPTVPRQSTANSFAEGKALGGRTTA